MERAEALKLIQKVADDPPADIRRVKRRQSLRTPPGALPAPESAELRMRNIRMRLEIPEGRRPTLQVDKRHLSQHIKLGDQ